MEVKRGNTVTRGILYTVFALFLLGGMVNCGGGSSSSSGSVQIQAPKSDQQQRLGAEKHPDIV